MQASELLAMMDHALNQGPGIARTSAPVRVVRAPRESAPTPAPVAVVNPGMAGRLRELADAMQDAIDAKQAPLSQNWTPRRARIKDGQKADADRLEVVRGALVELAELHELGEVPAALVRVRNRAQVERLCFPNHNRDALKRDGFGADAVDAMAKLADVEGMRRARAERAAKSEREARIRTSKRPGFFPTPDALADRMVELAGIKRGTRVLEPSAGLGALAIRARDAGGDVLAVEICPDLCRDIEEAAAGGERIAVNQGDFLLRQKSDFGTRGVDVVIMNPPFEKGAAWKHIYRAWNMLRPGGRLVALAPAGQSVPDYLTDAGAEVEVLEDAFKGPGVLRSTGVRVYLIVVDKPV